MPPPEAAGGPWGRGWLCWWPRYTRRRHAHARKGACQEPFTVSMAIGARVLLVRAPVHARTLQRAVATGFGPRQPRNNREQRRGERERERGEQLSRPIPDRTRSRSIRATKPTRSRSSPVLFASVILVRCLVMDDGSVIT